MAALEVGDRVIFVRGERAPETVSGDEIGVVIRVYRADSDEHNLVDVRFPSRPEPIIARPETEFELVQHHGGGSTA